MKDKVWAIKIDQCVPTFSELSEELRRYGFLHQFDFVEIGKMLIESMRYRTSVKIPGIWESELYFNLLKQTKLHLHSNDKTIYVVRSFLSEIAECIDAFFIKHVGHILTIDHYDLDYDDLNLVVLQRL